MNARDGVARVEFVGLVVGRGFGERLAEFGELQAARFQEIDAFIDDDSLNPSPNRGLISERIELHKHLRKRALQQVFGIVRMAHHAHGGRKHRPRIEPIEFKLRRPKPSFAIFNEVEVVLRSVQNFTGVVSFRV